MSILSSVVLQNPAPWRLILDSIQCRDRPNSKAMSFEGQFGTDTLTDERAHPPLVKACACSRYGMVCKAPNVLSSTLAKGLTQNSQGYVLAGSNTQRRSLKYFACKTIVNSIAITFCICDCVHGDQLS